MNYWGMSVFGQNGVSGTRFTLLPKTKKQTIKLNRQNIWNSFQDTGYQAIWESDHGEMRDKSSKGLISSAGPERRASIERTSEIYRGNPECLVEYWSACLWGNYYRADRTTWKD